MPLVLALAVRKLGLSSEEPIRPVTAVAAARLGLPDRGVVTPVARAELILLWHTDERLLGYDSAETRYRARSAPAGW
jgi:imidazolonepropionase-like amidohydrolase